MDDTPAVGELQPLAGLSGDTDCLFQRKPVVRSVLYQAFHIAATHKLSDHVGLVLFLSKVEHGDDVLVRTQAAHSLSLSLDARAGDLVQALGLDQGEGYLLVQEGVVGQVDLLLATLSQEMFDLVAAVGEGGGLIPSHCDSWTRFECSGMAGRRRRKTTRRPFRGSQES